LKRGTVSRYSRPARDRYLPRLAGPEVLVNAIRDGIALLTWQADTFAYAESHD